MANCSICNKPIRFGEALTMQGLPGKICADCNIHIKNLRNKEKSEDAKQSILFLKSTLNSGQLTSSVSDFISQEIRKAEDASPVQIDILTTTGFEFSGYTIDKYVGVIATESIIGTGVLSELGATLTDLGGKHLVLFEEKLAEARKNSRKKLMQQASILSCNAIIGMHYNYVAFSNNAICVTAEGTAVVIVESL